MLYHAILTYRTCYAMLYYTVPSMLYHAILPLYCTCYAMLYYHCTTLAIPCYTMLVTHQIPACYAMLCYAMLCYAMLCYATLDDSMTMT